MKLKDLITEMPLPADWDKSAYKENTSFASRLKYAQERAKKIGSGSSRVVFVIEYQGRQTILKIAKNRKGIAQNDFEAQMLGDGLVQQLGVAIPLIDYDEENSYPTWIHTEFAQKIKPTQFKQFFGGLSPDQVVELIERMIGRTSNRFRRLTPEEESRYEELSEENEHISALISLVGNYDLPAADFGRIANWGLYKGQPVIIDLGLSNDVYAAHYSR